MSPRHSVLRLPPLQPPTLKKSSPPPLTLPRPHALSCDACQTRRAHGAARGVTGDALLGPDVARVVLCHHERVDGRGYPNELHGDEIPFGSRVLQICDAWVAMTDPESYHPPEADDGALSIISRGSGSQFDSELAKKYVEMMRRRESGV